MLLFFSEDIALYYHGVLTYDVIILCFACTDVQFLPISGLVGTNIKNRVDKTVCSWWDGPCLFEALDAIEIPLRDPKGPFRYMVN